MVIRCQLKRRYVLWRQEDPEFAAKWDAAVAEGIDRLEDEAIDARLKAFSVPSITAEFPSVRSRKYSDKLLMFLIKRRRPEVYEIA